MLTGPGWRALSVDPGPPAGVQGPVIRGVGGLEAHLTSQPALGVSGHCSAVRPRPGL